MKKFQICYQVCHSYRSPSSWTCLCDNGTGGVIHERVCSEWRGEVRTVDLIAAWRRHAHQRCHTSDVTITTPTLHTAAQHNIRTSQITPNFRHTDYVLSKPFTKVHRSPDCATRPATNLSPPVRRVRRPAPPAGSPPEHPWTARQWRATRRRRWAGGRRRSAAGPCWQSRAAAARRPASSRWAWRRRRTRRQTPSPGRCPRSSATAAGRRYRTTDTPDDNRQRADSCCRRRQSVYLFDWRLTGMGPHKWALSSEHLYIFVNETISKIQTSFTLWARPVSDCPARSGSNKVTARE